MNNFNRMNGCYRECSWLLILVMQFVEVFVQERNVVSAMRHVGGVVLINENDRNLQEEPKPTEFAW